MAPRNEDRDPTCPASCPSCPAGEEEGAATDRGGEGLRGGRLVLASVGAFLIPVLLAILGWAFLGSAWDHPHSGPIGGAGGLALGLLDAVLVYRLIARSRRREDEGDESCPH